MGWVYTESGTQKRCKHCGQARPRSMFVGKQWKKPRPTCVDCAAKLSAQNATAEQPPPPPPARRWFSRAEPEPVSAEETLPVAEAEEPTSTEQPPPPAQRWFSETEPEA